MIEVQAARAAMFDALQAMADRFDVTADANERSVIQDAMDRLQGTIGRLALDDLLASADAVADAAMAVESAVAAAQRGPFSFYLSTMEGVLARLDGSMGAMGASTRLQPTPDLVPPPLTLGQLKPHGLGATQAGLGPPSKATVFTKLRGEYPAWFDACAVKPGREGELAFFMKMLKTGRPNYEKAMDQTGVPWPVVGILHGLEGSFSFTTHLHNGDPLSARTMHVPAGRPPVGAPPFTWLASAVDALKFDGVADNTDWSLAHTLFMFERFNGMGYRPLGIPNPYLWASSNLYIKGKFVGDGSFDPEAVSKQVGAGLALKASVDAGLFNPA